jgi:hypothetical protein
MAIRKRVARAELTREGSAMAGARWKVTVTCVVICGLHSACSTSKRSDGDGSAPLSAGSAQDHENSTLASGEIRIAEKPDKLALQELIGAVPTSRPKTTGPDGGTLIGTETGEPKPVGVPTPDSADVPPQPPNALHAGPLGVQPTMSNPAIERAAREQIYWPLVQKCRGPKGEFLPPDSITLRFTIRTDGTVDPASVDAEADEDKYQSAAQCVVREFSSIPFQGPPSSFGATTRINAKLPSVD